MSSHLEPRDPVQLAFAELSELRTGVTQKHCVALILTPWKIYCNIFTLRLTPPEQVTRPFSHALELYSSVKPVSFKANLCPLLKVNLNIYGKQINSIVSLCVGIAIK